MPAQRIIAEVGLGLNIEPLPGSAVIADNAGVLKLTIDNIGVIGVDASLKTITTEREFPVGIGDAVAGGSARGAVQSRVVLRAAINIVKRLIVVEADPVELGDRNIGMISPFASPVPAFIDAAIAADHEVVRIVFIE